MTAGMPARRLSWRIRLGWALGVLLAAGCASFEVSPVSDPDAPEPAWLRQPQPREYVLEVGDTFDLKLFYHPELNEAGAIIRPDGNFTAQLVGDVPARGRTVPALTADLQERYVTAGLRRPVVAVLLRKSAGLRVFVGGEVNTPGMLLHEGQMTLSRAVFQAGGPKSTAELRTVVLLRDSGDPAAPRFATVDFNKLVQSGTDPLLQPYDIVFVPKSTIAKLNQFVDQYFVKMVPVSLSAGFSYTIGSFRDNNKNQ